MSVPLRAGLLLLLLAAGTSAQFTVTGVFEYQDKTWNYQGWNGYATLPIRKADVIVLDDVTSAVLGTGSTADDGSFSIVANSVGVTDVVVRVDADTDLAGSFQRIRVTTEANVEYSAFSPVFAGHDTSVDLDVGTTTVLKSTSNGDEGNPFDLLDMGVASWEYITGPLVGAGNAGSTIRLYWPGGSGSFASGASAHMAEDDGYDDAVILHELGHVVQNMYSDSDSPGGSHFFGDSDQDPRLSFGEGYATFWAGAIMDAVLDRQALYVDANGSSGSGGWQLHLRLETVAPYGTDSFGAADEVAVATTLFDILDSELSSDQSPGSDDDAFVSTTLVGGLTRHQAWWQVFIGPLDTAPNVTINDAWNGWFGQFGASGLHAELQALFADRELRFSNDVDEPNDTPATAAALTVSTTWNTGRTLYAGSGSPPAPGLGDEDWYAVDVVVGSRLDLDTRYPGNAADADTQCDTELTLRSPGGVVVAQSDTGGTGRNASLPDVLVTETGTWTLRVRSVHSYRRYGRYDLRVRYAFQNFRPEITALGALPATILEGQTSVLGASASDANPGQVLSYAWTPLDGGVLSGSGASVTFHAPAVASPTDFHVQLVVSDDLGAQSDPAVVTISVEPGGVIDNGRFLGRPWSGGPPGPLGTPVLGPAPSGGAAGGVLTLDLGPTDTWPATALVGRRLHRLREGRGPASPVPEHVLPVRAAGGRVQLELPLDELLAGGGVLYVQLVRPDASRPEGLAWSTVLEITTTD